MVTDIRDRGDIAGIVTDFYSRAFADDLLGHVFVDVAKLDLDRHLPIMCDFWETVIFKAGTYRRNALQLHFALHRLEPLTERHFTRWLTLWAATIDDRHAGPHAEYAKLQAGRIAGSMRRRLAGRPPSQSPVPVAGPTLRAHEDPPQG
ncbi:group III truncated hemoglobin [Micromonospora avicenniae]|uniref:Hemoglobin n=1 Tax=Micromonospora avicenniae TaxID=1198245 RepID=A0A1N6WJU2_9ACTN|nr:group III truncated hemoglobin [Micromonospora avicenniae]SIQ90331.1 hemoglobin [Micromonospora avicenniae]